MPRHHQEGRVLQHCEPGTDTPRALSGSRVQGFRVLHVPNKNFMMQWLRKVLVTVKFQCGSELFAVPGPIK